MTPDGGHVFVQSSSDLSVAPADEVLGVGGGIFDLVAGRAVPVDCEGCISVEGTTFDGTAIVAASGSRLVSADTDRTPDLYLVDEVGPHAVSSGTDGLPKFVAMANDGSFVLFSIRISLVPADTDATADLYRWARASGALDLVTIGASAPTFRAMSGDGARVVFETGENILGIDLGSTGQSGVYEWTTNGRTLRGRGEFVSTSADGSRVYSNTTVALDAADHDAQMDGYVHDADGFHVLTEPSAGYAAVVAAKADASAWVIATPEVFSSEDTDTTVDYYLVSGASQTLVTRGSAPPNALLMDAAFQSAIYSTPSRLDPNDTDDWDDVYRWTITQPDAPELVSGVGAPDVHPLAYSTDGGRALMTTWAQLLPDDVDPFVDVYEWTGGSRQLAIPGDQDYVIDAWTADLQRVVVSAGALTSDDTNGNVSDVYLSDADLLPPTTEVNGPSSLTGTTTELAFGTADDDAVWFECQLDEAVWSRCRSPLRISDLADGTHQLSVRGFDAAGNSDKATAAWDVDATPPDGSVVIADGAAYTSTTTVAVATSASDAGAGMSQVALSADGITWTTRPYAAAQLWNLTGADGPATVWVKWRDGVGNWSPAKSDSIILDTNGSEGSVRIAGGSTYTATRDVLVSVEAVDQVSGISQVALSNDGTTWTTLPYAPTQPWTLPSIDGPLTVSAKWGDSAGNWSAVASDSIVLDTAAPTATAPKATFATRSTVSSGRITVRIAWSGADATSGIAQYEIDLSTDGRPYAATGTSPTSATTRFLAVGHSYRFRLRPVDRAGNVGAYVYGTRFGLSAVQESSSRISWSSSWRVGSSATYWGGRTRYATTRGAAAVAMITGRSFAWISAVGPTRGSARVYIDGVLAKTVSLYAPRSSARQVVFAATWSTAATRRIVIRVNGTTGHPRVDVDALGWMR